ncbi:DNA helicase [Fusarium pseudocircinatum]|uniref:DNA helicase n=1 Tax=Fusarium pseudocircinatum TaxID=56676 RepID=A0A8H5KQZ8_9HYPO|nr:DNA helicase [Fusarium pseudocircinatum]
MPKNNDPTRIAPKLAPKHNLPSTLKVPYKDSYLGLVIELPLSAAVENTGFGKCHHIDFGSQKVIASTTRKLTVKFPREDIKITYQAATEEETTRYPAGKKYMTWVSVILGKGASVSVQGFGMPYSNPVYTAEGFLRPPASTTVMDDLYLLDIIQQRQFLFLAARHNEVLKARWSVASLAPNFDYGYGADQSWDMERYMKQLHEIEGHRFQTAWNFETDASHVTAMTQSIVQDFMWIQKWCLDMTTEMGSAYFVKHPASRRSKRWLVIVKMDGDFWNDEEWSQACINGTMKLVVHPGPDELPESWTDDLSERYSARICHDPDEVRLLNLHPLTEKDFVIRNRVSFEWDLQLHDAKRQVDAVCDFLPLAAPNRHFFRDKGLEVSEFGVGRKALMMSLHRDLLRGDGFWKTMMGADPAVNEMARNVRDTDTGSQHQRMALSRLPSVNFLKDDGRSGWTEALLSEVSDADQHPLRYYLSNRPLGFGIITTGPNADNTSIFPVVVLAMHVTVGTVMASAPTPTAVNKFASDLHTASRSVACKYNIERSEESSRRAALVIRGFQLQVECDAFKSLLRFPHLGDEAAGDDEWGVKLDWTLHLSATFWLLTCLGSKSLPPLHKEDANILHEFQDVLAKSDIFTRLLERASGTISWEEYVAGETAADSEIMGLMEMLIEVADIVCTTPSLAHTEDHLKKWKVERARGVAIDEAGGMSRGDLYSIWGNTLLPCLLSGEEEFVPLEVKSYHDRDVDGNMRNRFGDDARKSALEFLTATGWPVYRVRRQ